MTTPFVIPLIIFLTIHIKHIVTTFFTQKNTLVYQNKHTFVDIKSTLEYNLLYDLDYNSDEVYLLEDKKTYLLIKRKRRIVSIYTTLRGHMVYTRKNKGNDIIKTTQNFKTFKVLYKNKDQTISQCIVYHNKIYLFCRITQSMY